MQSNAFTKLAAAIIILFCISISTAYSIETGSIAGKVIDQETNLPLPGASVRISGTNFGAVTNNKGEFRMLNIPVGEKELKIKYIGFAEITMRVNVEAGKTVEANFKLTPQAAEGQEVVVIGDALKGQAKALNTQRNKINVTNIVSADQVGRFPDANNRG